MHLPTSEKVAVKLIDKKNMRFRDIIRVKNEIEILKTVKHRNIMHLYEII
jgi:serine/threonine protein kinase